MADDIGLRPPIGWQDCGAPYPRFPQAASIRIFLGSCIHAAPDASACAPDLYSRSSACELPPTSSLHDREEVFRALCATAAAFKVSPLFDSKRHVMYVAVNLRGGLQGDRLSADDA